MSKAIATTNEQRRVEFQTRDLYPVEDCNIIIPYLPTGYEDYSNMGYVNGQYQISDYLTYKRIGTGNDCFIVTWKGSTQIIDNDTSSPITATGQCGEYILGYNTSTFGDVSIETDTAFTDYKKTVSRNTLTFRIDAQRTNTNSVTDLTENYKYMFYKVPEVTGDILLKVVSLETEYVGRKKIAYVLTLNSLQQDLETTGQARSQNVMPNAPGQGYYDPKIYDLETASDSDKTTISTFTADKDHLKVDANRWITYDIDKYVNDPVKYVVVKLFGNCLLCDFAMIGRRASSTDAGNEYGSPRWIFPINLSQATTPTLYRAQNPEDNFYGLYNYVPTILMTKDFTDYFKDLFQVSASYSIQGIVKIPKNYTFSNSTNSNGNFQWTLYASYDYSGDVPVVNKNGQFEIPSTITYSVSGVTGCNTTYTISSTSSMRIIHDYMWDAFWCLKKVVQIPIQEQNTLTFGNLIGSGLSTTIGGLSSGSGFSAIFGLTAGATLFTIGIAATAIEAVTTPNLNEGLMGFMSASLLNFMCDETQQNMTTSIDGYEYFFLNYLFGEGSNDYLTWFDTKSMMTAFQAELTDRFMKSDVTASSAYNSNIFTTELIGQSTTEDGNNILSDRSNLLVSGGETLQEMDSDNIGFIIDGFNLQSVFSGDFSVEFLNADKEVIWYGVYMTSAKWTGSIRSLNTFKNTSIYGRESIYLSEPKPGPAAVDIYSISDTTGTLTQGKDTSFISSYTSSDQITLHDFLTNDGGTVTENGLVANPDTSTYSYNFSGTVQGYNGGSAVVTHTADFSCSDTVTFKDCKAVSTSVSKDVTSYFNFELKIASSGGATNQTEFGQRFDSITTYWGDGTSPQSFQIFNKNTTYDDLIDDNNYTYIEVEKTLSLKSTTSSSYVILGNIDDGYGCSLQRGTGVIDDIVGEHSTGWTGSFYLQSQEWSKTFNFYSFLLKGQIYKTNNVTATFRITFKSDGVYFKMTKATFSQDMKIYAVFPSDSNNLTFKDGGSYSYLNGNADTGLSSEGEGKTLSTFGTTNELSYNNVQLGTWYNCFSNNTDNAKKNGNSKYDKIITTGTYSSTLRFRGVSFDD